MRAPLSVDVAFDDAKIAAGVRAELGIGDPPEFPIVGDRYRLLERLGEGSFGSVYRAHDRELDREVALKTLELDAEAESGREGRALARLTHPNVVRIYDHGVAKDYWYLVLELLDGQDLARWLGSSARRAEEIINVFIEAGRGLAAAHAAGLMHRDFKPSNVMVTSDGRIVVVDFGQARGFDTEDDNGQRRSRSGTLAYMAPERLAGEVGDGRSDQFSFCVALWEALAGENPFTGDDVEARFASIVVGPGRPPVAGRVGRALVRGLSGLRGDRFSSIDELLDELGRHATRHRRRPFLIASGIAAALLIGIGLLPEFITIEEGVADTGEEAAEQLKTRLDRAERFARAGDAGRAMIELERAYDEAEEGEPVLRCADRAMKIADVLLAKGHRPEAAKAYAIAYEGFKAGGLNELANWALQQASVAMDPARGSPRSK